MKIVVDLFKNNGWNFDIQYIDGEYSISIWKDAFVHLAKGNDFYRVVKELEPFVVPMIIEKK